MSKRGFTGKYLVEKTIDFGIGMLNSGIGKTVTPEKAEQIFREQAEISLALAEYCKEIAKKNLH